MVFKFPKSLGRQLLKFATCFRNYKQKEIYVRFLPIYIIFAYSDSYIDVIYYNIFVTGFNYCVVIDYSFLVKIFSSTYTFDIYFDFSKVQLIFKGVAVSFTTYKFLHSSYRYSLYVFTRGLITYIESTLLLYPVFLNICAANMASNCYYLFSKGVVTYLSFDDFRVLLVRRASFLLTLNHCFAYSFNVLSIMQHVITYFTTTASLNLQFYNNRLQITSSNLFMVTYITSDLDFSYSAILTITSDYCYITVDAVEFLRALSFIKSLHGDSNCDFYIVIVKGLLTIEYFSSLGCRLVSSIIIVNYGLHLKLCLNLGFCMEFLLLFPYKTFVLALLNAYSKVFMLSCDLYSYIYCIMPILT
ncbi:hypothetical protein JS520_00580 [Candidatus Vidania fulgoroideae]|nr:hypothetical protein JS520_00580 [Candidatus Vidania fulgoroideae]